MTHSLNEIEALCKKAARGAGFEWGLAEEAGKAARWLASAGQPGPAQLADLLLRSDAAPRPSGPHALSGVWRARSGALCPLRSGSALNDCADQLDQGQTLQLERVTHPLLLVPFAAWAAVHLGVILRISWPGADYDTDGWGLHCTLHAAPTAGPVTVTCTAGPDQRIAIAPAAFRGDVDPESWQTLERFAHRTYAPATEESRRLGAGAGQSDND